MKRIIAYALMLIGFIWISGVCLDVFSAPHHMLWIWHSQNLTAGDMIPRDDAIGQMRKLELAIQNIYQHLVIPALLMLIGGILNGRKMKDTEQSVPGYPPQGVGSPEP